MSTPLSKKTAFFLFLPFFLFFGLGRSFAKNPPHSPCAGYAFKKEGGEWFLQWEGSALRLKGDEQGSPFCSRVAEISCDRLSKKNEERLRIEERTGGSRCCTTGHWLRKGDERAIFIELGSYREIDEDRKTDEKGSAVFSFPDFSLDYLKIGQKIPGQQTHWISLPQAVCFENNRFYDCTETQVHIRSSLPSGISENSAASEIVEYIALSRLADDKNYKTRLKNWDWMGVPRAEFIRAIDKSMDFRREHYGTFRVSDLFQRLNVTNECR